MSISAIIVGLILFACGLILGYLICVLRFRLAEIPAFILHRLFDDSPLSISATDHDERYQYWSLVNQKSSGISVEQVIGKRREEFLPPGNSNSSQSPMRAALTGQIVETPMMRFENGPEGTNHWYRVTYWPIRNRRGTITGALGLGQSMRDLHQLIETGLQQSAMLASVKDAIIGVDVSDRITYWNQGAEQLYGYSQAEVLGRPVTLLESAEQPPQMGNILADVKHTQTTWRGQVIRQHKSGRRLIVASTVSPLYDHSSSFIGVVSVSRDITESVETQKLLRDSEQRFRTLIENLSVGVMIQGSHAEITLTNQAALDLLGLTEDQLIGKTSFDPQWNVIHENGSDFPGSSHPVPQAISTGKPVDNVVMGVYRPQSSDRVWLLVSAEPQIAEDGTVREVICTFSDITSLKHTEDALHRSELKFRHLFTHNPLPMWIFDIKTLAFLDVNEASIRHYGYSREEFLQMHISDIRPVEDVPRLLERVAHQPGTLENAGQWQHRLKDNRLITAEVIYQTFEYNGQLVGLVISQDVTARNRAEQALRDSEKLFRYLTDTVPVMIWMAEPDMRCNYLNKTWLDFTGLTLEQGMGSGWQHTIHPDDQQHCLEVNQNAFAARQPFTLEYRMLRSDENYCWVVNTGVPRFGPEGEFIGFIGSLVDITKRKQAEQALRRSEEHFRALIEYGSDVIAILDTKMIIKYVSPSVERILGYKAEEMINTLGHEYIRIKDFTQTMSEWQRILTTDNVLNMLEARVRHKDGSWRTMEFVISNMSENPFVSGIVVTCHDVTERKRVEAELRRQNAYLTAVHDTALNLLNRLNVDELLEAMLVRAGALLGTVDGYLHLLDPVEDNMIVYMGVGFYQPFIGYRIKRGHGLAGKIFETGQPLVINDYTEWAGRVPDVQLDPIHALIGAPMKSEGQIIGVLGLTHLEKDRAFSSSDVELLSRFAELASIALDNARLHSIVQKELDEQTFSAQQLLWFNTRLELEKAELEKRVQDRTAQLERRQAELQSVLDAMGEGVFYSDNFCIRYVNQALAKMSGYQIEELIGQPNVILQTDHPSDFETRLFTEEITPPGTTWRREVSLRRKDGTEFDAALTINLIGETTASTLGAVTVVRDITIEKRLEAQKTAFIANASHELRTPLTTFKTYLYLLRNRPENLMSHLEVLERVTQHMINLVEDMLDMTRFEHGMILLRPRDVELQSLLTGLMDWQQPEADSKELTLSLEMPTTPIHISVDPHRIIQVFNNLLVNAINYTPSKGQVLIQLSTETNEDKTYAIIRIQDTGIGITPEHLTRIFEPFYRVNEHAVTGTGLGLSISREIIELHGGTLSVESTKDQGSIFSVRLPLDGTAV